ncbi:MAG: hypothetical protein ABF242_03320 [Flavobacteriales bacterium]
MKNLLYFTVGLALLSCVEKTEKNSVYAPQISEINRLNISLDSSYSIVSNFDQKALKLIKNKASQKLDSIKTVYTRDTIDPKFEEIALKARGGLFKTIRNFLTDISAVDNEYEFCKKQTETLKQNLIHETVNKDEALQYTQAEKNALILLKGEIDKQISAIELVLEMNGPLFEQMDSIIDYHATN